MTGRELMISTQSVRPSFISEDSSPAPQVAKQVKGVGHLERPLLVIKDSRLAPRLSKKREGRRQKVAEAGVEDFIPWVTPISRCSPNREEEDDEKDEMFGLVHNFAARKRKRDSILEQAASAVPEAVGGSSQSGPDGGSEVQAIVILGSLDMSMNDQPTTGDVSMEEPREASPVPATLQVVHPPEEATGWLDRAKYTRTGYRKPLVPDHMLVNSYLPLRGLAPPMEEVTVPRPEGAQEIVNLWGPFNRGEVLADHLHDLYPTMLRMPVTVRTGGQGKEYNISVPCSSNKEDLLQMIKDGMQVRNRNFDQSTELVSLEALFVVPVLTFKHCHITNLFLRRRLLLSETWPISTENSGPV